MSKSTHRENERLRKMQERVDAKAAAQWRADFQHVLDAVAEEIRHPGGRTADEIANEIIGLVRHHDVKGVVDGVMDSMGARLFESELMDADFRANNDKNG